MDRHERVPKWAERYADRHLGHCPQCVREGLPINATVCINGCDCGDFDSPEHDHYGPGHYETWGWELICVRHGVFWQPFDADDGFEFDDPADAVEAMREARFSCECEGLRLIEPALPVTA